MNRKIDIGDLVMVEGIFGPILGWIVNFEESKYSRNIYLVEWCDGWTETLYDYKIAIYREKFMRYMKYECGMYEQ